MEHLPVYVIGAVFYFVIFSALGVYVSCQKGRGCLEGFVLGFLFGPFGILVAGLLPNLLTVADICRLQADLQDKQNVRRLDSPGTA